LVLDAGALIAFERSERRALWRIARAEQLEHPVVVPAGVLGQVWRDGRRQARLARLLASDAVQVVPLTEIRAKVAGALLAAAGTNDLIDASVVACAREFDGVVLTGDGDDMRRIDAGVRLDPF
jgi:predicted nucleic acid-binding protein